jgi:hypothetical protein
MNAIHNPTINFSALKNQSVSQSLSLVSETPKLLTRPIEFQIFRDGRVHLWGGKAQLFHFVRLHFPGVPCQSKAYRTGSAVLLDLSPKQINYLLSLPEVTDTQWEKGYQTTQKLLLELFDRNGNPVTMKTWLTRVQKKFPLITETEK